MVPAVELLVVMAVLAAVVLVVAGPLRRRGELVDREREQRVDLEAARDAKYREIRDAEVDFRTGKVSEEDFRLTDRELRGQAIEILRRLDEVDGGDAAAPR